MRGKNGIHRAGRWLRRAAFLGAATLAAAPAARAGEPVAQPCDCCKLVCIEAEILKAQQQRDFYKGIPKNTKMSAAEYEAAEQQAADRAESTRVKYADGNETCNYYDPNLADAMELRRMQMAGFQFARNDAGTIVGRNYSLKTNPATCKVNQQAVDYAPRVAACAGIGAAQAAHEQQHVDDCEKRDPAKRERTVAQTAADELAGYAQEIYELEQLRLQVAGLCKKASCDKDKAAWDRAAEGMLLFVDDVLLRGPTKPPSKSPLASRAGKGGGR
jgi:hypothetical protein